MPSLKSVEFGDNSTSIPGFSNLGCPDHKARSEISSAGFVRTEPPRTILQERKRPGSELGELIESHIKDFASESCVPIRLPLFDVQSASIHPSVML